MLQELAAASAGAASWAVASMLFFVAVWGIVAVRTLLTRREDLDARARLALDDGAPPAAAAPVAGRTGA
jgi:hypothetical protein